MLYYNYPVKATKNAIEGLILNMEKGSCKNSTGVKTARMLINKKGLNEKMINKIYSYLERAKVYVGDQSKCGYISYQLWGGKEMLQWCKKTLKK